VEVIVVAERFDMVQLLKDLRAGKRVPCPECQKGHFIPVGDAETTHGFFCSECNNQVNID
jgi:hypothetical protein